MSAYHTRILEPFPSGQWIDEIVCGSAGVNRDGSLTVDATIIVHSDDGRIWDTIRRVRLDRVKP